MDQKPFKQNVSGVRCSHSLTEIPRLVEAYELQAFDLGVIVENIDASNRGPTAVQHYARPRGAAVTLPRTDGQAQVMSGISNRPVDRQSCGHYQRLTVGPGQ